MAISILRIWYARLAHTTVTTLSDSLACVHSACVEYMALPSA